MTIPPFQRLNPVISGETILPDGIKFDTEENMNEAQFINWLRGFFSGLCFVQHGSPREREILDKIERQLNNVEIE